jgi:hypothetical protein
MYTTEKRSLMISRGWIQAAGIVLVIGFFIMGVLTYYTYNDEPPIPELVKDTAGTVLFTRGDIMAGQQIFLRNGLMEYGSIFGHGAYLGPDFTTEYLHRAAVSSINFYGGQNSDTARSRTIADFKANQYDKTTGTLIYSDAQIHAFDECRNYYASFLESRPALGATVNFFRHETRLGRTGLSHLADFTIAVLVMSFAFIAHIIEVALWAWLFLICGEFQEFGAAYYHSAVNYTTLGYGDIILTPAWKLLGPLEAADGSLMFGVSTAMIFTVILRLIQAKFVDLRD